MYVFVYLFINLFIYVDTLMHAHTKTRIIGIIREICVILFLIL